MEFRLDKHVTNKMKRENLCEMERVMLTEDNKMSDFMADEEYKCLGVLEADGFKREMMREIAK